jgi:outer membrane protein insertion porin family
VIAFRVRGRVIRGFRGKSAPPFDRYFMGGEDDIRGLSDWSASPITFMPDRVTVPVLNSDGSQRIQNVVIDNMIVAVPVTMQIPIFRPVALGGDMNAVANAEYRVPLKGPFTLVFFADLGLNKIVFADQLRLDPEFLNGLNNEFQEAGFSNSFSIAPHTQDFRMSTGAELRARIPKVGVPVRFYWAWDPRIDDRYIQPPIVADRSMFPNQTTFESAINTYAPAYLDQQSRNAFRFSIGRTF